MIFDMHCDTLCKVRKERAAGKQVSLRNDKELQVTLEKMKAGGYGLQNFAVYIDLKEQETPYENAMELVKLFQEELVLAKDRIVPVANWMQMEEALRGGKLCAMLTLEEGGMCEGDIEKLHAFYQAGARMMTLTWNYENELGYSSVYQESCGLNPKFHFPHKRTIETKSASKRIYGLKQKGFEFLEEMEVLGMIPDVSHLSDDGFWDLTEKYKKPFVASHSNARALCGHCRNLTDEMLHCLGERGGVAGLNYYPVFLVQDGGTQQEWLMAAAKHAVHMMHKAGSESVGLGSDFDGFKGNSDPRDVMEIERLVWAFHKVGLNETEIEGILHRNVARLYRDILK